MTKVLVIRLSSIGDIVLTTPVIRALHEQLGVEVHFLCKARFGSILAHHPYVSRLWHYETAGLTEQLRSEGYDAVIDLHKNLRTLRLRRALGVRSYTFDKLNIEKWLLVNLKIDRLPDLHIVDRYWAALAPLGIVDDGKGLDHYLPAEAEATARQWHRAHLEERPFVALVIGAAHATKQLPVEQLTAVCQALDTPTVLVGGPGDRAAGDHIRMAVPERVYNTCGEMSIHESAALLARASRVITHDTGMMHIAAALDKPLTVVWGNTVPAFGMYPYRVSDYRAMQHPTLRCRPCSKIGYAKCPKGHFRCMRELRVAEIVGGDPE